MGAKCPQSDSLKLTKKLHAEVSRLDPFNMAKTFFNKFPEPNVITEKVYNEFGIAFHFIHEMKSWIF